MRSVRSNCVAGDRSGALLWNISAQLGSFGDRLHIVQEKFAQHGYRLTSVFQDYLLRLAASAPAKSRLARFWNEVAREALASLTEPADSLRRRLPVVCAYRSVFLDDLHRSSQERASNLTPGDYANPIIEPTYAGYSADLRMGRRHKALDRLIQDEIDREIEEKRIHDAARALASRDSPVSPNLLVTEVLKELQPLGFVRRTGRNARGWSLFARPLTGTELDFYVLHENASLKIGRLTFSWGLVTSGKDVSMQSNFAGFVAKRFFEPLFPGVEFYAHAPGINRFLLGVRAFACLANLFADELQEFLSGNQSTNNPSKSEQPNTLIDRRNPK